MSLGEVVQTADGSHTIRLPGKDECYHSSIGAALESQELYLAASGFIKKINTLNTSQDISVLDVGLGLGYNALSTINAWNEARTPVNLQIVSLENNLELLDQLRSGKALWAEGWPVTWRQWGLALKTATDQRFEMRQEIGERRLSWTVHLGDASSYGFLDTIFDDSKSAFDYVWQDPFSPSENPAMWSQAWFSSLKKYTKPETILMTYSVARMVRDNLTLAGWTPEKIEAQSLAKRHWLRAIPKS